VVGSTEVCVNYGSQVATLPLLVLKGEGPSLLGRNWLKEIRESVNTGLDWTGLEYWNDL